MLTGGNVRRLVLLLGGGRGRVEAEHLAQVDAAVVEPLGVREGHLDLLAAAAEDLPGQVDLGQRLDLGLDVDELLLQVVVLLAEGLHAALGRVQLALDAVTVDGHGVELRLLVAELGVLALDLRAQVTVGVVGRLELGLDGLLLRRDRRDGRLEIADGGLSPVELLAQPDDGPVGPVELLQEAVRLLVGAAVGLADRWLSGRGWHGPAAHGEVGEVVHQVGDGGVAPARHGVAGGLGHHCEHVVRGLGGLGLLGLAHALGLGIRGRLCGLRLCGGGCQQAVEHAGVGLRHDGSFRLGMSRRLPSHYHTMLMRNLSRKHRMA